MVSRRTRWAYHSLFGELCQHHNDGGLVLPDHPPKVLYRVLQWCLAGYEGTLDLVALHRGGEDGKVRDGRRGEGWRLVVRTAGEHCTASSSRQ